MGRTKERTLGKAGGKNGGKQNKGEGRGAKGGAGGKAVQNKNPASSSSPPSNALPGGRWRSEEKPQVHNKKGNGKQTGTMLLVMAHCLPCATR